MLKVDADIMEIFLNMFITITVLIQQFKYLFICQLNGIITKNTIDSDLLNRTWIICESSIICIPAKHTIDMFPHVLIPKQRCQTAVERRWKEAYHSARWFALTMK